MSKKKVFQNEVQESAHKIWLAGLGALATAEEEGSKLFKLLVERGEKFEGVGREQAEEVKAKVEDAAERAKEKAGTKWDKVEERIDEVVSGVFDRAGLPNKGEIEGLSQRVEDLTRMVEQLKQEKN